MRNYRRIAANRLIVGNDVMLQGVVELSGDTVVRYYQLKEEVEQTEWLGGTLRIMFSDNLPHVYRNGVKLTANSMNI